MISIIVAVSKNRVIGFKGDIPWKLPSDQNHFKKLTLGRIVVMGRKTYESIGKPLYNRINVVLSKSIKEIPGCVVFESVDNVLGFIGDGDACVIGGEEIYNQFLPYAQIINSSLVDGEFKGDAYFPEILISQWRLILEREGEIDSRDSHRWKYFVYERISGDFKK
jgi:dihydrofolate reductase